MANPSTQWQEIVAADETERFARQGAQIRQAHALKNAQHGKGRFLHRKALAAFTAKVEVFDHLPEATRAGLFEKPAIYEALVRLSHGSFDIKANTKPDIRGFALKVLGVNGPGALGGTTDHQDFLLINHDHFASANSTQFVDVACILAQKGELALLGFFIKTFGFGEALKRLKILTGTLAKPFAGFAAERFNTVLPFAVGAYAARLLLVPIAPQPRQQADPGADILARVQAGPVAYDIKLQFFTDEAATPIENATIPWDEAISPLVTVGRLTLLAACAPVEALHFDPWGALLAHRPLGELMRARKAAYRVSQLERA